MCVCPPPLSLRAVCHCDCRCQLAASGLVGLVDSSDSVRIEASATSDVGEAVALLLQRDDTPAALFLVKNGGEEKGERGGSGGSSSGGESKHGESGGRRERKRRFHWESQSVKDFCTILYPEFNCNLVHVCIA